MSDLCAEIFLGGAIFHSEPTLTIVADGVPYHRTRLTCDGAYYSCMQMKLPTVDQVKTEKSTGCPSGSTGCPQGSTGCPQGSTGCPQGSTGCPQGSTDCPCGSTGCHA